MLRKAKFKWREKEERSLSEIVLEDGEMRPRDILALIRQICLLIGSQGSEAGRSLDPQHIFLDAKASVRLQCPQSSYVQMEAYNPPELKRTEKRTGTADVYALGMLMLFMATGKEKKTEVSAFVRHRFLCSLIERCTSFDPRERFQNPGDVLSAIKSTKRMMKKLKLTGLILVSVSLLAALSFHLGQKGRMRGHAAGELSGYRSGYAEGYDQGFADTPGIGMGRAAFDAKNGNLSGNLASEKAAFAACSAESVFFLQEGKICQMDPYTKEVLLLGSEAGAYDLQYYEGWIYYCTKEKVFRTDAKTKKTEQLCDSHAGILYISDDKFYLYDQADTGYLYRLDPLSGALTQLNGAMEYRCLNIVKDKLYYLAAERGNSICRCDLDGGNETLISSNPYASFCIYKDKLYAGSESGLISMDLMGGNSESLTVLPAFFPNVSEGGIFYIAGKGRSLEWMSLDGKTRFTLVATRTGSFNLAGEWIFYTNEEDEGKLWRVRISGSDNARIE